MASSNLTSTDKALLTDVNLIITDTMSVISEYQAALEQLGIVSTTYINTYEKYIDSSLYDAGRLKEKMKERLVQAVNNEL